MTIAFGRASLDNSAGLWAAVGWHLDAFAKAWKTEDEPPGPCEFLPEGPPEVRRLVLVELLKIDLDLRGLARTLEEYAAEFPELAEHGGPPCDLIFEDYRLRQRANLPVDPEDYYRRFPGRVAELARLLGANTTRPSTSIRAARAPDDVAPGDRLDDFDLLALLGEGQFAKVFLARQRTMQRLVALKVSSARGVEAETLAQLDHPNIVRVYDQRSLAERDLHLVYMAYLPGGTLLELLDRIRAIPQAERSGKTLLHAVDAALERRGESPPAASLTRQAWAARSWPATVCGLGAKLAAALDAAHRQNVLHRDLKPANVLLTAEGEPMLADFNVGCCTKLEGANPATFFGGSLAYMAPEHMEAFSPDHPRSPESLDGRADIYGLGMTLWELAAGERPFGKEYLSRDWGETLEHLAKQRRAGPLAECAAAFHEGDAVGLKVILLKCLEGDPERRPPDAGDLGTELELCLRPATRKLVRPEPGGWREVVARHPVLTLLPAGLAPNLLASLFNIAYNGEEIIRHWKAAEAVFCDIIFAVNGVFFPLGIFVYVLVARKVSVGVQKVRAGEQLDPGELARLRKKCLRLGSVAAGVCVSCWIVAGIVWPVALRIIAGPAPGGLETYIHFMLSLVICGLIAAAYPYFLVTFLAVRVLYPALLHGGLPCPADASALHNVDRELSRYLTVATAIPLLALALLASKGLSNPVIVGILSGAGLAGIALAFVLEGKTRAALTALGDGPG